MLSKTQSKYIRSLEMQKFRKECAAFIAEGDKIASEWLADTNVQIQYIAALPGWAEQHKALIARHPEATVLIVTEAELEQISCLKTPNQVLLVVAIAEATAPVVDGWCLALDGIRDPGNMGTILRIADWFGIRYIACSPDCVDVYSPKVVQSGMGAHLRTRIFETDLPAFIEQSPLPAIAAVLEGTSIYTFPRPESGILIIGNESKGISEVLQQLAQHKVTIPRYGGAESLNAGVSAGILCALLLQR